MKETLKLSTDAKQLLQQHGLCADKLQHCSMRSYSFGEKIVSEGMPGVELYLVIHGRAKVSVCAPNGKNLILCFYVSEGLMGEVEFFAHTSVGSTTVTALDSFRCIVIPVNCNRNYLNTNFEFTRIAAAELSRKLLKTSNSVMENSLYTAEIRLCRYILASSDQHFFRDVMTDVAYSIGISYRHLYRLMNALCRNGILKKASHGYEILDAEELRHRCFPHE